MSGHIVTFCEACGAIIAPGADDVVRLTEWADLGASFPEAQRWVPGFTVSFHRVHAPELSQKWRDPSDD